MGATLNYEEEAVVARLKEQAVTTLVTPFHDFEESPRHEMGIADKTQTMIRKARFVRLPDEGI